MVVLHRAGSFLRGKKKKITKRSRILGHLDIYMVQQGITRIPKYMSKKEKRKHGISTSLAPTRYYYSVY